MWLPGPGPRRPVRCQGGQVTWSLPSVRAVLVVTGEPGQLGAGEARPRGILGAWPLPWGALSCACISFSAAAVSVSCEPHRDQVGVRAAPPLLPRPVYSSVPVDRPDDLQQQARRPVVTAAPGSQGSPARSPWASLTQGACTPTRTGGAFSHVPSPVAHSSVLAPNKDQRRPVSYVTVLICLFYKPPEGRPDCT